MIHFMGDSYAAVTLKEGARRRGLMLIDDINEATLVFLSQDTKTDSNGVRDLSEIKRMIEMIPEGKVTVMTSQVPPGFCRQHARGIFYHQAETLRIEDGLQRAMHPEMIIVGSLGAVDSRYQDYLDAFDCPVLVMSYEDAEFAKIAINMTLASQVDNANRLSAAATKCGADWSKIQRVLRNDSRIGKYSYLTPGRWQDSKHLLRDYVTMSEL